MIKNKNKQNIHKIQIRSVRTKNVEPFTIFRVILAQLRIIHLQNLQCNMVSLITHITNYYNIPERADKKIGRLYQSWFRPGRLFTYIRLSCLVAALSSFFLCFFPFEGMTTPHADMADMLIAYYDITTIFRKVLIRKLGVYISLGSVPAGSLYTFVCHVW